MDLQEIRRRLRKQDEEHKKLEANLEKLSAQLEKEKAAAAEVKLRTFVGDAAVEKLLADLEALLEVKVSHLERVARLDEKERAFPQALARL